MAAAGPARRTVEVMTLDTTCPVCSREATTRTAAICHEDSCPVEGDTPCRCQAVLVHLSSCMNEWQRRWEQRH
jgi:hypothetical protein